MKPTQCPACRSGLLTHGPLADQSMLRFTFFSFWRLVAVRASVCLDCGAVTPYLADDALERLRAWNGYGLPAKQPLDKLRHRATQSSTAVLQHGASGRPATPTAWLPGTTPAEDWPGTKGFGYAESSEAEQASVNKDNDRRAGGVVIRCVESPVS